MLRIAFYVLKLNCNHPLHNVSVFLCAYYINETKHLFDNELMQQQIYVSRYVYLAHLEKMSLELGIGPFAL